MIYSAGKQNFVSCKADAQAGPGWLQGEEVGGPRGEVRGHVVETEGGGGEASGRLRDGQSRAGAGSRRLLGLLVGSSWSWGSEKCWKNGHC